MECFALEGLAAWLYRHVDADDDEPPPVSVLAQRALGRGCIEYVDHLRGDGALAMVNGSWRIFLRRRLVLERKQFAIAHELGEWLLKQEQYRGEDIERCANYLAAAISTPRRAFLRAMREEGENFGALARRFLTTETHVALRGAEVTGRPRIVVAKSFIWVRGDEDFVLPPESVVRSWTRGRAPATVRKTRLRDNPTRYVLDPVVLEAC